MVGPLGALVGDVARFLHLFSEHSRGRLLVGCKADAEMATILIVDDISSNRDPIAKLLQLEGHRSVMAENGREALRILDEQPIDAVLLDLMMPEMDGVSFLRRLRQEGKHGHVPVIVLSALRYGDAVDQAHALGAKAVLLKAQFTFADLMMTLRRVMSQRSVTDLVADAQSQSWTQTG